MLSFEARFWAKVNKNGPVMPGMTTPCWVWTGCKSSGYGRIGVGSSRVRYSHRASWEMHVGPIPAGLLVCHHCDNRSCVRPETPEGPSHLFLGTDADNLDDMRTKGRDYVPPPMIGEQHALAKLTEKDVLAIYARLRAGALGAALAREYGVTPTLVSRINLRRTWKHLLLPLEAADH